MVRIIRRTKEQGERNSKFLEAIAIAEKSVGAHHVFVNNNLYVIDIHNSNLLVYTTRNVMHVRDPSQLDLACDLAERYEKVFEVEYIVRETY
ncbi:MAG: hypothetical protein KJ592_00365 [Nanoarchaeota archaeon]|nr:hypothetical protein [Nanoarchaeota archaeon]